MFARETRFEGFLNAKLNRLTYSHLPRLLLRGFGGDFGGLEGERGEIVCCGHGL